MNAPSVLDWINLGIVLLTGGGLLAAGSQRRRVRFWGFVACLGATPLWLLILEWPGQWGPWAVTGISTAAYIRGGLSNYFGSIPLEKEQLESKLKEMEKEARRWRFRHRLQSRINERYKMLLAEARRR